MQRPFRIVQSAIRANDIVIPGLHHYDNFMIDIMHILDVGMQWGKKDNFENGYLDQHGTFYTNAEAILLAIQSKQIVSNFNPTTSLSHALWSNEKLMIVCPAVYHESYIFLSPKYFDQTFTNWSSHLADHDYWRKLTKEQFKKGFIDSNGIFHDPYDALYIAQEAKQLLYPKEFPITQLLVEDLF